MLTDNFQKQYKVEINEHVMLQAFRGENKTVPVWIMRQAGRYLPDYQKLREKYSLEEMFRNPEIAAEVTCLPFNVCDFDAAILFADILTLPSEMGFEVTFEKKVGPVIKNPIEKPEDIKRVHDIDDVKHIRDEIALVLSKLNGKVPLIGFAGSPFTVLCYLMKGNSQTSIAHLINFAYSNEGAYRAMMEKLTKNTIFYIQMQKQAGIQVFQIFDTWAGLLRVKEYESFVLPYVQEIFQSIELPSIYYLKNCHHLLQLMNQTDADFLSVCETINITNNAFLLKSGKGVQGNFYNALLYSDLNVIEEELKNLLNGAKRYNKYIFNLSHGIFPDIPVEKVKFITDYVHQFSYR